jgi:pimeloyl-ACP methyl ester carboxylesterase
VPENRAESSGRKIRLAVAVLKSRSANPEPDPVIFLSGGPGSGALYGVANWRNSSLREHRDLILFDQRGSGYSQPDLRCPEIFSAGAEMERQSLSVDERVAREVEAAADCRGRLIGEGIELGAYNSAASAADLNDLRLALGLEQWNLYGLSYGGRLALTAMRDYPEGIRSAVLDSPRTPIVNDFEVSAADKDRVFQTLFAGCAADPPCAAAYPDLEGVFEELVRRLNEKPAAIMAPDPETGGLQEATFTGDDLVGGLFNAMYDTAMIPYLPLAGYQIHAGNYDVLEGLSAALGPSSTFSQGMFYSVLCYEEMPFNDPEAIRESREAYPLLKGYLAADSLAAICGIWGSGEAGAIEASPVVSDIPTLVMVGEYDPIHPRHWGQAAVETLSRGLLVEFPGVGHGASFGPCQGRIRDSFIENPAVAPDTSCTATMTGPAFVTGLALNRGVYEFAAGFLLGPEPGQLALLGFCLLLFLSAVIGWPLAYLIDRRRGKVAKGSNAGRAARWLGWVVAALNLSFFVALVTWIVRLSSAEPYVLLFGLPSGGAILFVLPLLAAVLTVGLWVFAVVAWMRGYWSPAGRVHYSLVALAALEFVLVLSGWNLLLAT